MYRAVVATGHRSRRLIHYAVVVSAALAGVPCARAAVQTPTATPELPPSWRLTVRPRVMATATRTLKGGLQVIDSLLGPILDTVAGWGRSDRVEIYVPPQCVGARRCPLLLRLHPDIHPERVMPLADQYGIIFLWLYSKCSDPPVFDLALTVDPGVPFVVREMPDSPCVRYIDDALTQVLRHFAIDPDKIGVLGASSQGGDAMFLGRTNPEVFSRVLPSSPANLPFDSFDPPNPKMQVCVGFGLAGDIGFFENSLRFAQAARQDGLPVKVLLSPRDHESRVEEHVALMRWLAESWAAPAATARREAQRLAAATPGPLLTADALARLATFWTRFMAAPDSIRETARAAHMTEVPVLLGQERVMLLMADLPALAARYPAVAAALQAAGLTARQAEAYRLAALTAWAVLGIEHEKEELHDDVIGPRTAVQRQNMALLTAHPELVEQFTASKMWNTP